MFVGEGLFQEVRWDKPSLIFDVRTRVQQVLAFTRPAFVWTSQLLGAWVKTAHSMGMASFHLRANVRKSPRQFSTYLFPKWVTDNCSTGIKLHASRKGTSSYMHLGGNIYNREKKSFLLIGEKWRTPQVSFLFLTPSNLRSVCSSPRNSVSERILSCIMSL